MRRGKSRERRPATTEALVDEGWKMLERDDPDAAAGLARRALASDLDATDAYVVLAASTPVVAEAVALLREAVRLADPRSRGTPGPEVDRSALVRAHNDLARLLWTDRRDGRRVEAVGHATRALGLDPDDRAGTRYLLMSWYAELEDWKAARRIARRYRDEWRADTRYWLALHAFRDGDASADRLLDAAHKANPHVPSALLRPAAANDLLNGTIPIGLPDEAAQIAAHARAGWTASTGALAWLSSRSSGGA